MPELRNSRSNRSFALMNFAAQVLTLSKEDRSKGKKRTSTSGCDCLIDAINSSALERERAQMYIRRGLCFR